MASARTGLRTPSAKGTAKLWRPQNSCSLLSDLRWRRNDDLGSAFIQLDLACNCNWVVSQGLQEFLSSDSSYARSCHVAREDLIRIMSAEVEKGVAFLGDAHLLNQAANTDISPTCCLASCGNIGSAWQ